MSNHKSVVTYHPVTTDQLVDFALGTLDSTASRHVSAHLAEGCPECENELNRLNAILGATRTHPLPEPPSWVLHRAKRLFVHHEIETVPRGDRVAALLMDSRTVVGTIVLAAVLVVGLSGAYIWRQIPTAQTATLTVDALTVEIQPAPDGEWAPAKDGAAIGTGMSLRTGERGGAKLTFPDDGTLELENNSRVQIGALHTLTSVGPQVVRVSQNLGDGHYRISPGGPAGGFTVTTPVTRLEGRETEYDLTVEEDGTTIIQVYAGALVVSAGDQEVTMSAGERLVISPTAPQEPLQPSPFPATSTPEPTATATTPKPAAVPARLTKTPTARPTATAREASQPHQPPPPTATPTATWTSTPTRTPTPTLTLTPSPTVPPTDTPVPPTPVPPTPVPPTNTPVPPTPTPVPPTNTPAPPTNTSPPPTPTPVPPTLTPTHKPPPPPTKPPLPTIAPPSTSDQYMTWENKTDT